MGVITAKHGAHNVTEGNYLSAEDKSKEIRNIDREECHTQQCQPGVCDLRIGWTLLVTAVG
jgi:hypothetical protein